MISTAPASAWLAYHAGVDADCESCPYWQRPYRFAEDQDTGTCHRNAPREDGTWPPTQAGMGWCGEHPSMRNAPAAVYKEDAERYEFLVVEAEPS